MKVITFHGLKPFDWIDWAADNDVFYQIAETRIGRADGRWFPIFVVVIDAGREVEVILRWSDFVLDDC